ncbi:hypothetical protein [Streptacidiphilus sp. ASG 303]|uniref:hypothetical protein n=1 Tax=Streptomycetaceae TaxID=2062 RepID=UPI001E45C0A9|nr:hypothetical protein [Streptacidiphilus sp. ASG 303]MCD0481821.1 hypothetical protein [Streptacidiphilus sp. ASG 303]
MEKPPRTELHKDLDAAVQTRKELGPEYEEEVVDAFLARVDARLDARVEQRVAERLDAYGPARRGAYGPPRGRAGSRLAVISLALGIPLSGVGGGTGGLTGLVVVWAGIVGVNAAAALGERREEREERRRRRDGWE